jgi:dTDP-4-dehydrorhamnose reductase
MNILVTGANGQLGTEIRNLSEGMGHRFIFSDVNAVPGRETVYLDITNLEAIRIVCASEAVDVIVNCAAYTDVAKAEDDIGFADLLNHVAPGNLAAVARERGATLIHISTDYVFHGDASVPYREDDEPHPLGVYGSTKLQGEDAVRSSGCKYLIFRTAWLYSPYGKNFVKTMRRLTEEKPLVKCVFDQVGTPTYAADLAAVILKVIADGALDRTGIYHYTDEGVISWYDFAQAIARLCGHTGCDIRPCHSDEFPSKAARPHYSVLDKTRVKETFGVEIPYWLDSLQECIKRLP